jgi:hypothetical protein
MAPEILIRDEYNNKADIYSLVTLFLLSIHYTNFDL